MAKRLTDSCKWQDPWFMDLPSKYKLFWLYLLDNCDHAGIWKVNFKIAAFYVGEHLEPSEVKRILNERLQIISDEYWMVKKFIDFQYGGIKNDQVGISVQKILISHNLLAPKEGLKSPLVGTKAKAKTKVKDLVKVKDIKDFKLFFDDLWIENMNILHKGKDVQKAISEVYGAYISDPVKFTGFDSQRFRSYVNTWLSNMRIETVKQERDPFAW
jgi:hypothetical protein